MGEARARVLVYGDANLNATDGSAIWVQSTVEVFARVGCEVVTLLRTPVETRRHLEPLEALSASPSSGRSRTASSPRGRGTA